MHMMAYVLLLHESILINTVRHVRKATIMSTYTTQMSERNTIYLH